eukprot:4096445-Pleurochrysis_carterae.AAC.2
MAQDSTQVRARARARLEHVVLRARLLGLRRQERAEVARRLPALAAARAARHVAANARARTRTRVHANTCMLAHT